MKPERHMIRRIVQTVILSLVMAGCAADRPSCEKAPIAAKKRSTATSAKSNEPLRGLQSLSRVQLRIPGATEDLQADAVKQLREELPQLETDGTSDNWTLEISLNSQVLKDWPPRSVSRPENAVTVCHIRVLKTAVVDGRLTTVVAYDGGQWMERYGSWGEEGFNAALHNAIIQFAAAWRRDNPIPEPK